MSLKLGKRLSNQPRNGAKEWRAVMPYSENISKKEAARIVGVSESTIVRWVKAGKFPQPFAIEGRTFFYKPEVDQWLAAKREQRGFQEAFATL